VIPIVGAAEEGEDASDRVRRAAVRAGSLYVMRPVKAAWCCRNVRGFGYAGDTSHRRDWLRGHLAAGEVVPVKASRGARLDEVAAALTVATERVNLVEPPVS
jgi:hypothetical protein